MNQKSKEELREAFASIKTEAEKRFEKIKGDSNQNIFIGMATCGLASGAIEVKRAFEEALAEQNIPPPNGPMILVHHRYFAKLSVNRVAKVKAVLPHR